MAAIDKLYGTYAELDDLRSWVVAYYPKLLFNMIHPFKAFNGCLPWKSFPIACFTHAQDKLLLWRCPLPFVREYLETKCGMKTRWYHKLFWKGTL